MQYLFPVLKKDGMTVHSGCVKMLRTMEIKRSKGDPWRVNVSDEERLLPERAAGEVLRFLEAWCQAFKWEPSWARTNFGVPTLFARADMTVGPNGEALIYEIEDKPAGMGFTPEINRDFARRFAAVRATWPEFSVVQSPKRKRAVDDHMWMPEIGFEEAFRTDGLLLVRGEPNEDELLRELVPRSVSTVTTNWDKVYGAKLGMWNEVRHEAVLSGQDLPWDKGFCLKPLRTSGAQDVHIWNPRDKKGGSTRSQIMRALERQGAMYLQPFMAPMTWQIEGRPHFGIYRVFFGFNTVSKRWVPLGGLWMARHGTMRIHGASDTVTGAVTVA